MKIYLAHNFAAREALRDTVRLIESLGHEVTSSWITDDSHVINDNARKSAEIDLADIDRADALILFTSQWGEKHGKGKFMEFGYAIAKGKRVFIYGPDQTSSVFYHLPQVIKITFYNGLERMLA